MSINYLIRGMILIKPYILLFILALIILPEKYLDDKGCVTNENAKMNFIVIDLVFSLGHLILFCSQAGVDNEKRMYLNTVENFFNLIFTIFSNVGILTDGISLFICMSYLN